MKTAMKITALAVITVLLALACSPEAEMTNRDFSEKSDSMDAKYTGEINTLGSDFEVSGSLVYGSSTVASSTITVKFPKAADVLKKADGNNIITEMSSFLTFHTISDSGDYATNTTPYKPGTLGASIPYTFYKREGTTIHILLSSIPNVSTIVWRFNASKYTQYNGTKTDNNQDGIAGNEYDDQYGTLSVSGGGGGGPYSFLPPVAPPINLSFSFSPSTTTFDTTTRLYVQIASLDSSAGTYLTNAQIDTFLGSIVGKFSVEMRDTQSGNKSWAKLGITARQLKVGDASPGSGVTAPCIYVELSGFTNLALYRVKGEGLKGLEIPGVGTKPAKVFVSGAESYLQSTFYSEEVLFIRDGQSGGVSPVSTDIPNCNTYSKDENDRKVVLHINLVPSPTGYDANKIKLVNMTDVDGKSVIDGEIKIEKIELNSNKLILTLNPSFKLPPITYPYSLLPYSLLFAPGALTYTDSSIWVGDLSGIYYAGTFFWREVSLTTTP